jgi:hypothetical protein
MLATLVVNGLISENLVFDMFFVKLARAVGVRWFLPLLCVESSLLVSASEAYKQPKRHMILKDFVAFNVFVVSLGKKC